MMSEEYVKIMQRKPEARWISDLHEGVYSEMEMDFWLRDLQQFIEKILNSKQTGISKENKTYREINLERSLTTEEAIDWLSGNRAPLEKKIIVSTKE